MTKCARVRHISLLKFRRVCEISISKSRSCIPRFRRSKCARIGHIFDFENSPFRRIFELRNQGRVDPDFEASKYVRVGHISRTKAQLLSLKLTHVLILALRVRNELNSF